MWRWHSASTGRCSPAVSRQVLKASSAEASHAAAGAEHEARSRGSKPLKVLEIHVQDPAAGLARAINRNSSVGLGCDVTGPMRVWPPKIGAFRLTQQRFLPRNRLLAGRF